MDGNKASISPIDLYAQLGTASAPILVDVRCHEAIVASDRLLVAAIHRAPDDIELWRNDVPLGRRIVVYCEHGGETSQRAARMLHLAGVDAVFLDGGIDAWRQRQLPTRRNVGVMPGLWVTRARPKIDRIACPWLVHRFIDPRAKFLYVPAGEVRSVAEETGAVPFDIDGVEYSHDGDRCSFDTILRRFEIEEPALVRLATIVRGADTSRHDLAPQCGGLFAISLGLSANFVDDQEMLRHGLVIYDALYTWCRKLQAETHNRPSPAAVTEARLG
jgi:rhodanese-related sulfurtransferase